MGYSETLCQLCGVSFAIARYRRPDEPPTAAWDCTGSGFRDADGYTGTWDDDERCVGCFVVQREAEVVVGEMMGIEKMLSLEQEQLYKDWEHLAGRECKETRGYSGWRISLDEMKGCRTVQCLAKKDSTWRPEPDDEDFERNGDLFLTGFGDGSPDEAPLEPITPPRHGTDSINLTNIVYGNDFDDWGLPFHPTCFNIFKRRSLQQLGCVDVAGLWEWRGTFTAKRGAKRGEYEDFFYEFPRAPEVLAAHCQWWEHAPGNEWLVANPIEIPELQERLRAAVALRDEQPVASPQTSGEAEDKLVGSPNTAASASVDDPFIDLPLEVAHMILSHLPSTSIENLRCVSRAFRSIPGVIFRELLRKEMDWFWEVEALDVGSTNWFEVWKGARANFGGLKGLRNRRRVWEDVGEILARIEKGEK